MRYQVLEHTADVMIRTTGKSLDECFANAAYALMDQTLDAECVRPLVQRLIDVEGMDLEYLLVSFLSEFLYIIDTERLVFSEFDVRIDGLRLRCIAKGETFDPERHSPKKEIKAITYHMIKVDPTEPSVQVIFDI